MKNSLDQYALNLEVDHNFAQILVYIDSDLMLKNAKKLIEELGISILSSRRLSFNVVVLKLDTKDMRNVILKLTENGFHEIRGYNASSF